MPADIRTGSKEYYRTAYKTFHLCSFKVAFSGKGKEGSFKSEKKKKTVKISLKIYLNIYFFPTYNWRGNSIPKREVRMSHIKKSLL